MKLIINTIIIISLVSVPGFSDNIKKPMEVYIIQDGKEMKVSSSRDKASLVSNISKKEFSLKFVLYNKPYIKVNVSDNSYIYNAALNNIDQVYLFPFFTGCSFAENNLNKDKDCILSNDANHFWYYENKTDSRFDSVKIEGDKYICIRTIKNIYNRETKEAVNISKIKNKELYFTILEYNNREFNKTINWGDILNDPASKHYSFIKWGLDNDLIDSSTYEEDFFEELGRVCFIVKFK
ncbi:MAG: hypothetical protein FWH53_09810 [Leptospirales bacterium]|nr:hypothetical protein [Leptospirales bacterium]